MFFRFLVGGLAFLLGALDKLLDAIDQPYSTPLSYPCERMKNLQVELVLVLRLDRWVALDGNRGCAGSWLLAVTAGETDSGSNGRGESTESTVYVRIGYKGNCRREAYRYSFCMSAR